MTSDDADVNEAGPTVRPYMVAGGRTPGNTTGFDRVTFVVAVRGDPSPWAVADLNPEHIAVRDLCRTPIVVAEIAARLGLAVNVVRVLLADLAMRKLVTTAEPARNRPITEETLKAVLHGLQRL